MSKLPFEFDASKYEPEPVREDFDEAVTPVAPAAPSGSATPVLDWFADDGSRQQDNAGGRTRSRHVTCHIDDTGRLILDDIPDGYTEEEKELLEFWYPEMYGKPSEHTRSPSGVVITGEDALLHARAVLRGKAKEQSEQAKQEARELRLEEQRLKLEKRELEIAEKRRREAQAEKQSQFVADHMEWVEQCAQRKRHIEEVSEEWRKRQQEKRQAMLQWDTYVAEARSALQNAKSIPVPPRPVKSDYQ